MDMSRIISRVRRLVAGCAVLPLALSLPAAAEPTLKVWTIPWDDVAMTAFKGMVDDYKAAHPGADIAVESRGIDEHKAAMRVAANSGAGPDIYYMWAGLGLGGDFVNAGISAPLDAAYTRYKWDDRFLPAALNDSRRYKGQRHGVPFLLHGEGLYYNKALFKRAGIAAPPASYEELLADAAKLKAAGIPSLIFGGSVNWHLMRLMDELLETKCGADKHDALTAMQADWSKEPCATQSFAELKRWTDTFLLKPFMGLADDQAQGLFYAGRVAMALEGDWFVHMIQAHADIDNFGLFLFPTGTDRLYSFSEYFYVNAHSPNQEAATAFLDFVTSPAEQQKYLGKFGTISVDKEIDYSKQTLALDKQWNRILTTASKTFVNGDQAFPVAATTEYWRIINQVASDALQPEQAAQEMQRFIANQHH
jgi:raffinose/stachyose/melibiose transport system substrate-binding protein